MKLHNDVPEALKWSRNALNGAEDHETWIIPQSGGKDSRTVAQIMLAMVNDKLIPAPKRMVFYMADTMGEFPSFIGQAKQGLVDMSNYARDVGIESHHFVTTPNAQSEFWVRVIGFGFTPPTKSMRWCTDLLKIAPARKILRMNKWNKSPKFLGVRYGESAERDERLKEEDKILSCTATGECGPDYDYNRMGKTLPKFAPIKQWKACAVWDWLTIYSSEYSFDNQELINHYDMNGWMHDRDQAIEHGMDESQNLRYGCWYCPMVYNDKTAEHLSKKDPMVGEMMTFANDYLRRGGKAWKSMNRQRLTKMDGEEVQGVLDIDFSWEMYNWMLDFEKRWNQPLLNQWQKGMIEAALEWRTQGGTWQNDFTSPFKTTAKNQTLEQWL